MPVVFKKNLPPAAKIAVWKIEEDENFFLKKMRLSPDEQADVTSLRGIRKLEWLACRWLLHELTGFDLRLPLAKDAFSKPFFEEKENLVCSLSHSRGVVAAMFCDLDDLPADRREGFSCGCDLQLLVEKMEKIAPKFTRTDEFEWLERQPASRRLDLLHFFWTAKESLYKAWGKKELDFRGHLRLSDFRGKKREIESRGWIEKGEVRLVFEVFSEKFGVSEVGDFVLTWCFPLESTEIKF